VGTAEYVSPEQAEGKAIDGRSDIYSLGVVVFHMLTGAVPFEADTPMGVLMKHVMEAPPSLRQLNPALPVEAERALLRALAKKPEQRYQRACELAQALAQAAGQVAVPPQPKAEKGTEAFVPVPPPKPPTARRPETGQESEGFAYVPPSQPVVSRPEPAPSPVAEKVAPRQRRPWLWAGGLVMAAVGILGVWLATRPPPTPTQPPVTVNQPTTSVPVSPTPIQESTPTIVPTPVPTLSLPVLAGTPVPQPAAAISASNAGRVTQLARWGKGSIAEIVWSAGGNHLAVASSIGIYFYDAQTLQEIRFIETTAPVWSVAFSPDGQTLASGSHDGTVRLWGVPQ